MYASGGLWGYSYDDCSNGNVEQSCASLSSESDSEDQELRDLEDLLYSHVHYEPNYHCTGTADEDLDSSRVYVTLHTDGEASTPGYIIDEHISAGDNSINSEALNAAKALLNQVLCNSSPIVKPSAQQTTNCGTVSFGGERTKSKKVNTDAKSDDSAVSISQEKLVDDKTAAVITTTSKPEKCKEQRLVKKKRKKKRKSKLSCTPETGNIVKPIVVDSASDVSSVLFCGDQSSEEFSSDGADDIKVSNVNIEPSNNCDTAVLSDVLNSLSDCNWNVNAQDRSGGISSLLRYYTPPTSRVRCANCSERGHFAKDCPLPKRLLACILCGQRGHLSRSCPGSLCYVCHRPGHAVRECDRRHVRHVSCRRCGVRGHFKAECPDLWRQYHLTTKSGRIVPAKSKKMQRKCCYNCGATGHFGHECDEDRVDSFSVPTLPFVVKYDTHSASSSPSGSHRKQEIHSNTGAAQHKKYTSSTLASARHKSRHQHRNISSDSASDDSYRSTSTPRTHHRSNKANFSVGKKHLFSEKKKKESRDIRNNHGVDVVSKHKRSSFSSARNPGGSGHFHDRVNGKLPVSRQHTPEQRKSKCGGKAVVLDSSSDELHVFRENGRNTVPKKRTENKSLWSESSLRGAGHRNTSAEKRGFPETSHTPSSAKRKKKVKSAVNYVVECKNNASSFKDDKKERTVIKTSRGFYYSVV